MSVNGHLLGWTGKDGKQGCHLQVDSLYLVADDSSLDQRFECVGTFHTLR